MPIDVEHFYRKYAPMVMRRCRLLLRNEQKALDATQDTFVRLLRSRHQLTAAAPSSLLYRIATNVCLNLLRSERTKPAEASDSLIDEIAGDENLEESFIRREVIERVFRTEKPTTRTIAVMHYVDGLSLEEVAAKSGLSVSGVRKRLRLLKARALERKEVYE